MWTGIRKGTTHGTTRPRAALNMKRRLKGCGVECCKSVDFVCQRGRDTRRGQRVARGTLCSSIVQKFLQATNRTRVLDSRGQGHKVGALRGREDSRLTKGCLPSCVSSYIMATVQSGPMQPCRVRLWCRREAIGESVMAGGKLVAFMVTGLPCRLSLTVWFVRNPAGCFSGL